MKKQLTLISGFVLLNLIIGRLFHESLNLVCFSELLVIAVTSFIFWTLIAKQLKKGQLVNTRPKSTRNFIKHGSLSILTSVINVLISQGIIVLLMIYVYQCTSPSFTFLNASLTNNIAINLMCYFALVYSLFETHKNNGNLNESLNLNNAASKQLILSSGTKQHIVRFNDVNFVEASNNCIVINTVKGQFVKYQSLKSFIEEHGETHFKRIHRSYAVNTNHIDFVERNKNGDGIITLKNKATIKLSRNFKLDCLK